MISLLPITVKNALTFKAVRLRALQDTPSAFGSTYAREIQLTDADWIERAHKWNGERGAGFLAMDNEIVCGMVGSFLNEYEANRAHLISVWTAGTHRKQGIGRLLVSAVSDWARGREARTLLLMVTCNNASAILFYERLGFTRTGRMEPYPNDPALVEYEMSKPI
jgi:ribosomal protein S18 acetylase RimI-like enzyme